MLGRLKGSTARRLGVHTSIAGGISTAVGRAAALGCSTMQIFSHSPRRWTKGDIPIEEARRFSGFRNEHDIAPVFIHASYLINLASPSETVREKSIALLTHELEIADKIGAEYVVLHTGSASGGEPGRARERAVVSIGKAAVDKMFRAKLLLENTAGRCGDTTSSVADLAAIIGGCGGGPIGGICIDTCHAFASGYDLSSEKGIDELLTEIEEHLGLDGLKLIHLNDSKRPMGSGVDRHEHIGKGFIGLKGFAALLCDKRIVDVPLILETPKKMDKDDPMNLRTVRRLLAAAC